MSRPRILYVEDEPAIVEPMAKALDRAGFEALTARTAREALELDERLEPDLLLLDLSLPDGDGRDVCREVRRRRDVPVIMLTARGTETDRIVGLEIGADDYVVKPFSSAEVIARVRAVLRRAAPAGEPAAPDRRGGGRCRPRRRRRPPSVAGRRRARAQPARVRPARAPDARCGPRGD